MMQDFLRLARANTKKNLETCGVLAGSLVRELNFTGEITHYFLFLGGFGWGKPRVEGMLLGC